MYLWNRAEYREMFREAGPYVPGQDTIPDEEIDIPSEEAFPTEDWETRAAMVDRYRTWGTLLTVGGDRRADSASGGWGAGAPPAPERPTFEAGTEHGGPAGGPEETSVGFELERDADGGGGPLEIE